MWTAWLLIVTCFVANVRAAACPSGSDGDECRVQCARQCNGHIGCDVDACGLMTCDCSGYGDIDVASGKCRCDAGHNPSNILTATDCAMRLEGTDCAQSQQVATFQPPVPYAICSGGIASCHNGATVYSNGTFSSGVQLTTTCNPPRIGPYALKALNPLSTAYLGVVRGARYEMALRDIGSVEASPLIGDGPLMWFTFERRSTTVPIYTIHSAFDHNRTLEMLTISGVTVIQLSHQRIHNPTVWYIPVSPHLFESFAIYSNRDRSLHLAYSASVTAYGQYKFDLLTAAQQAIAAQWYVHIAQNQLAEVSLAGYAYSTLDSTLLRPSFAIRDPLACLDHCRRDLLCIGASYREGVCYMFRSVGAFAATGISIDRGWRLLSKPFSYGTKPTYCLLPSLGADCQPITIGNVRLQSGGESVTLQQDASVVSVTMATKTIQWTNRGGTQANPVRGVTGSPNWRFVNVDNGNEYIIFPQGSNSLVLGVVSGSTVGLVAYNPATPVTWFRSGASTYRSPSGTNATISDPALWLLSSNPNLRLGSLAATPTILSVATSSASFAVSTFRWAFNENDPYTATDRQMVGHHYESRYAPSIMHCFSGCSLSAQCRSISWYSLGQLCYMYDTPVGVTAPAPSTTLANWTSVSKSYGDIYFGTCVGTNDFSTNGPDKMAYPDVYSFREPSTNALRSTMGEAFISPARSCITPSAPLMLIRLQRNDDYVIRKAHGGGVFAELRDLVTIGIHDGWRFTFRYTKDATGVFEIYSGASGYETLEMYRDGKSEGDSDAELKLILKDVRPAQPARWRCRGWPSACDSIESFEEPGRFIQLCSSFTTFGFSTPVCATYLTTYSQIVATDNKWTIDSTLRVASVKGTGCAFNPADIPIAGYSFISEDYNACIGTVPRISFYNAALYDTVSRLCNIYRVDWDTWSESFLPDVVSPTICEVLPPMSTTTGTNCGIYGFPANEHGCHGPTVLPNLYLTQPTIGSLGVTPVPSSGITPFILVASGHDTNTYSICNWEQAHFTQTSDPGGQTGLYNGSTSISFYPTSCISHNPITNGLSMERIAESVPAVFQLSGLSIQAPGACVFNDVVITLNQPGVSQYMVFSSNHNPSNISVKLVDQMDILGVTLEWSIRYYHCEQMMGTNSEAPVYDIFPDFYTYNGAGSSGNYLVERFISHSVLDCQGRAIDYLMVGGFVFQPQVRGGLCSLFTNFGYLLKAGFGQTSMTASPGAVAWRRGNFGAQRALVINPTYPATMSSWSTDPDPSPIPAITGYGLYTPWAPGARGYGQWSSRIGLFCTGGPNDGHGRFAMTQPYSPEEDGIQMTNALFPIMEYASACSSNEWWRPYYDAADAQCTNVGFQGVTPKSNCPGALSAISVVPGETWSADPEQTYILKTLVFNVVMVSGGNEAGRAPRPGPQYLSSIPYVDGLWVALTVAPYFGLGSVASSANRRFLCVAARTTDSGYVEPIFELRPVSDLIDGYGRSFSRLRNPNVSWRSVPRDCLFQLHNWNV